MTPTANRLVLFLFIIATVGIQLAIHIHDIEDAILLLALILGICFIELIFGRN